MTIASFISQLENEIPPTLAEDFDNVGLLVGDKQRDLNGINVCLDCTEEVVDETIERNCNLIICFHPIIFSGLKKIVKGNYVENTVIKAIENKIAIYAIHTNLDNYKYGSNYHIGQKIGLINSSILSPQSNTLTKLTIFAPVDQEQNIKNIIWEQGGGKIGEYENCSFTTEQGVSTYKGTKDSNPKVGKKGILNSNSEVKISITAYKRQVHSILQKVKELNYYEEVAHEIIPLDNTTQDVGMGVIGELEQSLPLDQFISHLKNTFNMPYIRHNYTVKQDVKKIALVGGSGYFGIKQAMQKGADTFITADLKYHNFFPANGKINLLELGHYEMEQFNPKIIADISKKFYKFAVQISDVNTNPIKYS